MSPILRGVALATLIPLVACGVASDSDDLDDERLLDEGESEGEAARAPVPGLPLGAETSTDDPEAILGGWIHDSDRDVLVSAIPGICSGTLLRNDVVMTARICVEIDNGIPLGDTVVEGPVVPAIPTTVVQDGPGASLGTARSVVEVAYTPDGHVALLRLDAPLSIEGRTMGASTQIYGLPQSTSSGRNALCQGFGRDTEDEGTGVLRAGLVHIAGVDPIRLWYQAIDGWGQLQWIGDGGSSCRDQAFADPRLRKILGVHTYVPPGNVPYPSNQEPPPILVAETGTDVFRGGVHDQLDLWAGGDVFDDFTTPELYEVDEPPGMIGGPSNWQIAGGVLTESSNAYLSNVHFEGSRFVNSAEVINDGGVAVTVTSPDNDGAGLVLRVRDDTHYYRFSVDEQRDFARIVRRDGEVFTVLAEDLAFDIDWSTSPRLEFLAAGGWLVGYVDDEPVVAAYDAEIEYTAGRVGVYQWALANATFDDLEIRRF